MNTPFSEYKKARIYDLEVKCEPLQLSVDYVDIDLIYYFHKRYDTTIAPAYANYMAPFDFIPEEVISEKADSKKSDVDPDEPDFMPQSNKAPSIKPPIFPHNENNLMNDTDSLRSPIGQLSKSHDLSQSESPKNVTSNFGHSLRSISINPVINRDTSSDEIEVDYDKKLSVGQIIRKNEAETFETDVYNFNVIIESITILVRDGEIENFIDCSKGNDKSSISPIIEIVIDDLQYITQTNTIKERVKIKHHP